MGTLKFETDDEKLTIASRNSRQSMAKTMNRLLGVTAWYTHDETDIASIWRVEQLDIIFATAEKYGWVIGDDASETAVTSTTDWREEAATEKQLNYLRALEVDLQPFANLTKGHASQLIDAAKNDRLGSVIGAFYTDGSN